MFNNCKRPVVLIKEEENGTLCMRPLGLTMRFDTCNSLDTEQQWVILKTGNASDSIHICSQIHDCLTAYSPISFNEYVFFLPRTPHIIKPNNEARMLRLNLYQQSDTSQHWLMNSL